MFKRVRTEGRYVAPDTWIGRLDANLRHVMSAWVPTTSYWGLLPQSVEPNGLFSRFFTEGHKRQKYGNFWKAWDDTNPRGGAPPPPYNQIAERFSHRMKYRRHANESYICDMPLDVSDPSDDQVKLLLASDTIYDVDVCSRVGPREQVPEVVNEKILIFDWSDGIEGRVTNVICLSIHVQLSVGGRDPDLAFNTLVRVVRTNKRLLYLEATIVGHSESGLTRLSDALSQSMLVGFNLLNGSSAEAMRHMRTRKWETLYVRTPADSGCMQQDLEKTVYEARNSNALEAWGNLCVPGHKPYPRVLRQTVSLMCMMHGRETDPDNRHPEQIIAMHETMEAILAHTRCLDSSATRSALAYYLQQTGQEAIVPYYLKLRGDRAFFRPTSKWWASVSKKNRVAIRNLMMCMDSGKGLVPCTYDAIVDILERLTATYGSRQWFA